MMAIRYRLDNLFPTTDGSGQIKHDMWAEDFNGDPELIPNHHKSFMVPASEVATVMDMPDSTGPERQAKNAAYKALLYEHRLDGATPFQWPPTSDWSKEELEAYVVAYAAAEATFAAINEDCMLQAARMMDYLTITLGLDFPANPISFDL